MEIPETLSTLGTSASGQREKKHKQKTNNIRTTKQKTKQNKTKQKTTYKTKEMSNIDPTIQLVLITACATGWFFS